MRFLVFADLHLDAAFSWARPESARRRRQALRDALERILALADEHAVDAILCAGDLYEQERFTPDTRAFLATSLGATDRPVFVSPGNHDWYGREGLYAQTDWPANVHVFDSPALVPIEVADGLTLWGAAHTAPITMTGFFDDGFRVDRSGVNLALFHGAERTILPTHGNQPYAPFDASQIEAAGLDHAFIGHFHRPKDAERFTYPGNPEPLTFGEDGVRAPVLAVVAADGTVRTSRHPVSSDEVHDEELVVTGLASFQEVRERATELLAGQTGIARLTVTGELSADVELDLDGLGTIEHTLEELVVVARAIAVGFDLDAIRSELTVRGRFVRDVEEAEDLDESERRRILLSGLRALEGREDLELF